MTAPEPPDLDRLRAALARLGQEAEWPEPDSERVFSALHGEMSAEDRREVVDELVRNPHAAAAWRLARELEPDEPSVAEARSRAWTWISVAAMVAIAAGAAWQFQPWSADAPVYRSAEPRTIESRLPEDVRLPRAEPVLRWSAIDGARYRVRVLTPELDLLDEADVAAPEYRLPPEVLRQIRARGAIFWQVEARVDGASPVVSPTFTASLE